MKPVHFLPLLLASSSLVIGEPAATPPVGTSAATPPVKVSAPADAAAPAATGATPATAPVAPTVPALQANPAVAKVNQLQAEFSKAVQKLAENDPELKAARTATSEASRDSFKSIGTCPELQPIRDKRSAAINKLGNALKIRDKAGVAQADAEMKAIAAEMEAKIATIPDLVAKRDKAKAARENFQKIRDKAIAASPETKKLQDELEAARKAIPAPAPTPAPANP